MKHLFLRFEIIVIFLLVMLSSGSAFSQQLLVATGSEKGTYNAEFNEINKFCANDLVLVGRKTSGSVENLNLLLANKVNAAWVQSDLLYRRSRTEDLGSVKTLLAMHPEQLHFVTLAAGFKEGGYIGFGGKTVHLEEISQLSGRRIGASGGSVETAKQVRLDSEIKFDIVEYPTNEAALAAIGGKDGVDAVLMVVGAPSASISALGRKYSLIAVGEANAKKLAGAYKPAVISYSELGASGVPTVAIDSLFITREYKTAKMQNSLATLRNCVLEKLDEIKETTGTHPAWQNVKADNKGKWPWYNLPEPMKASAKSK